MDAVAASNFMAKEIFIEFPPVQSSPFNANQR
jgi:hypothetical protein